jgi:hypothetical protein
MAGRSSGPPRVHRHMSESVPETGWQVRRRAGIELVLGEPQISVAAKSPRGEVAIRSRLATSSTRETTRPRSYPHSSIAKEGSAVQSSSPAAVIQWIASITISPYDVIDSRIDVGAQKAILRMAKGAPRLRADALGILAGVKSGRLAGVFGDDLGRVAQVAARLGTVRWKLVPPDRDAVLLTAPTSPAMIVFREGARSVPSRLDPALREAFRSVAAREAASPHARAFQTVTGGPLDPLPTMLCGFECALCAAALLDGVPFDEIIPCEICLACASGLN